MDTHMERIAGALEGILAFMRATAAGKVMTAAVVEPTVKAEKAPKVDKAADKAAAKSDKAAKGDAGAKKPVYTQEQVREIVKKLAADEARGGRPVALKILLDIGKARQVKDLAPEFFDAVYDAVETALESETATNEDAEEDPTDI